MEKFRAVGSSRYITQGYRKAFDATVTLKGMNFANETIRTAYINVTNGSTGFVLTLTDSAGGVLTFNFPQTNITSFTDPNISGEDLMKIDLGLLATGTLASEQITLINSFGFNYCNGATIS